MMMIKDRLTIRINDVLEMQNGFAFMEWDFASSCHATKRV